MDIKALVVDGKDCFPGDLVQWGGDITTLNVLWPGAERETEQQLGYQSGRLSLGYHILLLEKSLSPSDFRFSGTTLRSGGRLGLPANTPQDDEKRVRVDDEIRRKRGADEYVHLQKMTLRNVAIKGEKRLAKLVPEIRHDHTLAPSAQYPMGGGALQWTLNGKHEFLLATYVGQDGIAHTPDFFVNLATGGYEARERLRRYMMAA